MPRFATYIFAMFFPLCLMAQRTAKVKAEYTYMAPENITLEQAKRVALERAQLQAIADEFGTIVSQSNTTLIRNDNGNSTIDFQSLSGSDVKGEWIETFGEPVYSIRYEQGMLVVHVKVAGRAREIVSAQIDIVAKVLRNGTEPKFEDANFRHGDDMYLYFKSPVDGYLAVYLLDETSKAVYCLLPYSQSADAAQRIVHDRPYVFFSAKDAPQEQRGIVDEMAMTCSGEQERNDLYIIFSPNAFAKANSESFSGSKPRQLNMSNFNEWLIKVEKHDKAMVTEKKIITIAK